MKKIVIGFALALALAVNAFAVENSNTFMPLTGSAVFLNRVIYILAQNAPVVLTEASATACHGYRTQFARNVAANPQAYAPVMAFHLVTNINVTSAGALTGAGATLDTPATDAALFAAISALWNTVAGCITNP